MVVERVDCPLSPILFNLLIVDLKGERRGDLRKEKDI